MNPRWVLDASVGRNFRMVIAALAALVAIGTQVLDAMEDAGWAVGAPALAVVLSVLANKTPIGNRPSDE